MSESVVIMKTPAQCGDCHLCNSVHEEGGHLICGYTGRYVVFNEKPLWCPLCEIPRLPMANNDSAWSYKLGWNDCACCLEQRCKKENL